MTVVNALRTMLAQDFVAHALLAGTFIAAIAGATGYFVVLRNQVFVADAQTHTGFTGAVGALAAGGSAVVGLFGATVIGALVMGALGGRSSRGRDVAIGTTFAWVLGVGVLFTSIYTTSHSTGNGTASVAVLFGSVFGISAERAWFAAAVAVGSAIAFCVIARPLLFASIDPDVAAARGVPVRAIGILFMILVGITVAEAAQVIGALLIFGLMVTPALVAHQVTARPWRGVAIASATGVASVWIGITISYVAPHLPPGFTVVAVATAAYVVVIAAKSLRRRGRGVDLHALASGGTA